jgi:hypothetical protein
MFRHGIDPKMDWNELIKGPWAPNTQVLAYNGNGPQTVLVKNSDIYWEPVSSQLENMVPGTQTWGDSPAMILIGNPQRLVIVPPNFVYDPNMVIYIRQNGVLTPMRVSDAFLQPAQQLSGFVKAAPPSFTKVDPKPIKANQCGLKLQQKQTRVKDDPM